MYVDYTISDSNLHICKSCRYRKSEMLPALRLIREIHAKKQVWRRSEKSLVAEWEAHNALYNLHIMRSRTAEVDLNYPQKYEWAYFLLAPFAKLIIK